MAKEINEDKEFCLDKVNTHLEKILENKNRDKRVHKRMASRYQTRNQIAHIKIKQLQDKLKQTKDKIMQTLINQDEKGKLDFLVDASMVV